MVYNAAYIALQERAWELAGLRVLEIMRDTIVHASGVRVAKTFATSQCFEYRSA